MRRLVVAAVVLAVLAVPSMAPAATYNRQIGTKCDGGKVRAYRIIDGATRLTDIGCPSWTFWAPAKGQFVTWTRPTVDIEAAVRSAGVWWSHCARQEYWGVWGGGSSGGNPGWFYTYFQITCP